MYLDANAIVLVHLINPKEQFWGMLFKLDQVGVVLRGLSVNSFDEWARQVARGEEMSLDVGTMFFPLFRVERIFLDERVGIVKSYSQQFHDIVGRDVHFYIGVDESGNESEN